LLIIVNDSWRGNVVEARGGRYNQQSLFLTAILKKGDAAMKKFYPVLIAIMAFVMFPAIATAASVLPWDKIIKEGRFIVLSEFHDEAVLDNETGVIWERFPDGKIERNWFDAQIFCAQKTVGNRRGWRLPTIQEFASLMDFTQQAPALPSGHPFKGMRPFHHFSATQRVDDPDSVWYININRGGVSIVLKSFPRYVWCVRDGQAGRFIAKAAQQRQWDETRFTVLSDFKDEAVLDNETGLVWERFLDPTPRNWTDTQVYCNDKMVGNRKGWRVPTVHELATLGDWTKRGPGLPDGHPFKGVKLERFSTSTIISATTTWYMHMNTPQVSALPKHFPRYVWCVRGGVSPESQ
jgi:hypothetical protein